MLLPKFQFSLLTLSLTSLLAGAVALVVRNWEPWQLELTAHSAPNYLCRWTPDFEFVVTNEGPAGNRLWDLKRGRCVHTQSAADPPFCWVQGSRGGRLVAIGRCLGRGLIIDTESDRIVSQLSAQNNGNLLPRAFSPDRKQLLIEESWGLERHAFLYDVQSGERLSRIDNTFPEGFVFTPRGRVVTFSPERARVIDTAQNTVLLDVVGDQGTRVTVSPSGAQALAFVAGNLMRFDLDACEGLAITIDQVEPPGAEELADALKEMKENISPRFNDDESSAILNTPTFMRWVVDLKANRVRASTPGEYDGIGFDGRKFRNRERGTIVGRAPRNYEYSHMHLPLTGWIMIEPGDDLDRRLFTSIENHNHVSVGERGRDEVVKDFSLFPIERRVAVRTEQPAQRRSTFRVYRNTRPSAWWGILWMPEFWFSVVLFAALFWSTLSRAIRARKATRAHHSAQAPAAPATTPAPLPAPHPIAATISDPTDASHHESKNAPH